MTEAKKIKTGMLVCYFCHPLIYIPSRRNIPTKKNQQEPLKSSQKQGTQTEWFPLLARSKKRQLEAPIAVKKKKSKKGKPLEPQQQQQPPQRPPANSSEQQHLELDERKTSKNSSSQNNKGTTTTTTTNSTTNIPTKGNIVDISHMSAHQTTGLRTSRSRKELDSKLHQIFNINDGERIMNDLIATLQNKTDFYMSTTSLDRFEYILAIVEKKGLEEMVEQLHFPLKLTAQEEELLQTKNYAEWWTRKIELDAKLSLNEYWCQPAFQQGALVKDGELPYMMCDKIFLCGFHRCLKETFSRLHLENICLALHLPNHDGDTKLMIYQILFNVFQLKDDQLVELESQQQHLSGNT